MRKTKKGLWLMMAMALVVSIGFGCATTEKATAPAKAEPDWRFHTIVDVNFVEQYAKMPKPEGVLIIDSRPKRAKYDKGYIPTAISIPDTQFAKMTDKLPTDKNTLLIFYCGGPT